MPRSLDGYLRSGFHGVAVNLHCQQYPACGDQGAVDRPTDDREAAVPVPGSYHEHHQRKRRDLAELDADVERQDLGDKLRIAGKCHLLHPRGQSEAVDETEHEHHEKKVGGA